jgi:hypothetical protein
VTDTIPSITVTVDPELRKWIRQLTEERTALRALLADFVSNCEPDCGLPGCSGSIIKLIPHRHWCPVPAARKLLAPPAVPDWSPGDVIAAYPDGRIVLDDGVTTYNPERAADFLKLADRSRLERTRSMADNNPERADDRRKAAWIPVAERLPENTFLGILAVHVPAAGPRRVVRARWVARWSEDADYDGDADYLEDRDEYFWPEGWYELTEADEAMALRLPGTVTHWMPLPSLPPKP